MQELVGPIQWVTSVTEAALGLICCQVAVRRRYWATRIPPPVTCYVNYPRGPTAFMCESERELRAGFDPRSVFVLSGTARRGSFPLSLVMSAASRSLSLSPAAGS
ncbi:hypothetical protein SKAU_G00292870 [Synaphobranchus kaupii]|uniref:Uncharacterized protein n=1 Tax=Synaphobranchus kaupii TaxID=118154 RepID=A0A9Q1EU86_SYNKA|nr:hypothetical protein SKAU_G00292870 [Synaphobranchus kaupii]